MMIMKTVDERFDSKWSEDEAGCWIWTASTNGKYGKFWDGNRIVTAHRFALLRSSGESGVGLDAGHQCPNKLCVNPDHLAWETHRENIRKSNSPMGRQARQITCKRGHDFDYVSKEGKRSCTICRKETQRARRELR